MKLVLKNWMMLGDQRLAPGSVVDLSEAEGARAIEQGTAVAHEYECSGGVPQAGLEKLAIVEETKPAPEPTVETTLASVPDIVLVEEVPVEEAAPPEEVVEAALEAPVVAAAPVAKRGPRKANLPDV